jgi:hypothetical protein
MSTQGKDSAHRFPVCVESAGIVPELLRGHPAALFLIQLEGM